MSTTTGTDVGPDSVEVKKTDIQPATPPAKATAPVIAQTAQPVNTKPLANVTPIFTKPADSASKQPPSPAAPINAATVSKQPTIPWKTTEGVSEDNLADFAFAYEVPAKTVYRFRGVCLKCGWQTHQPSAEQAKELVMAHAKRHILGG